MSIEHYEQRGENGLWLPWLAQGEVGGIGSMTTLPGVGEREEWRPIGFRGAQPGPSFDGRGKPRIRVKAGRG